MRIDELIELLQKVRKDTGNCPVGIDATDHIPDVSSLMVGHPEEADKEHCVVLKADCQLVESTD